MPVFLILPAVTPYSQARNLNIVSVTGPSQTSCYSPEELTVDATGAFDNPFDSAQVKLDAHVTDPSGSSYDLPGFYYRSFKRSLEGGTETLTPNDDPNWRIRILPTIPGAYKVVVRFQDRTGFREKLFEFQATSNPKAHGPVKVSPRDHHFFEYQDKSAYFPIGGNLCWAGPRGTYDYDDWLTNYQKNRCNCERLWLSCSWSTFALERKGDPKDGLGPGMIDLASAWKLDHVLDTAEQNGVNSILCIDSSNELRSAEAKPDWAQNPLNRDNGGPLRVWTAFWGDPDAAKIYDDKLRYVVARYGAREDLFAWELWENVDRVEDFDPAVVKIWHGRTTKLLKQLDPYRHLISTSFAAPEGGRDTLLQKEIDFDPIHIYNPQMTGYLGDHTARRWEWGKPSLIGEVAADNSSPHAAEDTTGVQVHDPLWIGLATGSAGGAMPWYWDTLVAANNLYGLFAALGAFTADIDFPGEALRSSDSSVAVPDPKEPVPNIWCQVGNDVAFAWIQQKGRSWQAVVVDKKAFTPTPASVATINDLASGNWRAEVWDTWNGKPISATMVTVGLDGKAAVHLPSFTGDLAIKLRRTKS